MKKCPNCNAELPDNASFCEMCGTKLEQFQQQQPTQDQTQQNFNQDQNYQQTQQDFNQQPIQQQNFNQQNYQQNFNMPHEEKPKATGQIIWSIINIVLCCGGILGIIALIFSIMANTDSIYSDAKSKLKVAMILNIIGTVLNALGCIYWIVYFFVLGVTISSYGF